MGPKYLGLLFDQLHLHRAHGLPLGLIIQIKAAVLDLVTEWARTCRGCPLDIRSVLFHCALAIHFGLLLFRTWPSAIRQAGVFLMELGKTVWLYAKTWAI